MLAPAEETVGPIGWLTPEQELVYQAALLDGEAAVDAWSRLMRLVPVEELEYSCQRALPLVFRNLERQGLEVPEWSRLKSVYRWTWSSNQTLIHAGREALVRLHGAEIDTLLLKGSALMYLDYEDTGVRPMADLDVLVRPEQVDRAVAELETIGWSSRSARSPARIPLLWTDELRHETGKGMDLHWRVLLRPGSEEELWRRSVPVTFGGVPSRSLSPADRLVHVCVHGLAPSFPPAFRWAADATTILRRQEVDWDGLVDLAQRSQVSLAVGRALEYVSQRFDARVPAPVVERLLAGPHPRLETVEYELTARPMALAHFVRWHWLRYRRVEPRRWRALWGYPRYLQLLLGYDDFRGFAGHVARRLGAGKRSPVSRSR